MMYKDEHYVIGADFGSDSVRVVVLDAANGKIAGQHVEYYPRWKTGAWCDPAKDRFRQHPSDYTECLHKAVKEALLQSCVYVNASVASKIRAICIDTTGSTPCFADRNGTPLALLPEFAEDSDAMFILWKDHSAVAEADEINRLSRTWGGTDYTRYTGGVYSSEWFWAKALHTIRTNPAVSKAAYTMVEHCDWIVAELTGTTAPQLIKRSRCAAGHKILWHKDWGGYPPREFFDRLDSRLGDIRDTLGTETWTTDTSAGTLTARWAADLGLSDKTIVCVGAYDAHIGAIGGNAREGTLVKSIGTSTCDIIIARPPEKGVQETLVPGICGQVDGSVVPGWIGYEAGQSAWGDYFAWFRNLLMWPVEHIIPQEVQITEDQIEAVEKRIIRELEQVADKLEPSESAPLALDWINGRRTPIANQKLTAALTGLKLGTDAPMILRSLLESVAFGARAIIETFEKHGIKINRVMAIGGVARKSMLGMQILADITNRSIHVTAVDQACATGAAVFASVAAGLYPDVFTAQKALSSGTDRVHKPDPERVRMYNKLYEKYLRLGAFIEGENK